MGLRLGSVLHHGGRGDRRGAVSPRNCSASTALPIATTIIALGAHRHDHGAEFDGTRLLARVAMFGFVCELVGAIVVGVYLLLFARHQPLKALIRYHHRERERHYLPAFLASFARRHVLLLRLRTCGDVAEETPDASRMIPKAMRMTSTSAGPPPPGSAWRSSCRFPTWAP